MPVAANRNLIYSIPANIRGSVSRASKDGVFSCSRHRYVTRETFLNFIHSGAKEISIKSFFTVIALIYCHWESTLKEGISPGKKASVEQAQIDWFDWLKIDLLCSLTHEHIQLYLRYWRSPTIDSVEVMKRYAHGVRCMNILNLSHH